MEVWKKAHLLTKIIYQITSDFPRSEHFGITSQMRRASVSIPSNIAEGCGRDTNPDFARFLTIAAGSCSELQYLLLLASELGYIDNHVYNQLNLRVIQLGQMLYRLKMQLPKS